MRAPKPCRKCGSTGPQYHWEGVCKPCKIEAVKKARPAPACKKCGSTTNARERYSRTCTPCREALGISKYHTPKPKKPVQTKEQQLAIRRAAYKKSAAAFKAQGLNSKGKPMKKGWSNPESLTPLHKAGPGTFIKRSIAAGLV